MKRIIFFLAVIILFIVPKTTDASSLFRDVPLENSHYPYIYTLSNENIINGFENNKFKPGESVTRKQAAVMIYRSLNLTNSKNYSHKFKDVNQKDSAYHAIHTLAEIGILPKEKSFTPHSKLKREDMAHMLSNAFKLSSSKKYTFPDVKNTDWAYSYINNLATNGITTNHTKVKFDPKSIVTRAQFASFLGRALSLKYKYINANDVYHNGNPVSRGTRVEIVNSKSDNYTVKLIEDKESFIVKKEKLVNHQLYFPSNEYFKKYISSFAGIEETIKNGINDRSMGEFIIEGDFNLTKFPLLGEPKSSKSLPYGAYQLYDTAKIDNIAKLYFNKTLKRGNAPTSFTYEGETLKDLDPIYMYTSKGYYLLFGDKGSYPFDIDISIKEIVNNSLDSYSVVYDIYLVSDYGRDLYETYSVTLKISDKGIPYIVKVSEL